ncbi:hypothetical protein L4X63_17050 [Geomonas sp. Red32]|uniref:hypothetical protein n=1 Tax=Geomonas sp. Red32 TaxID=2912856 RepID=UPI00202D0040|nr:hypothetical protein [Geomonas sp. Red32]MCM0083296.1 hypothetical protein [Geomonas sp. Red32]
MEPKTVRLSAKIAVVGVIFGTGFFCGSVTQRNADAQMEEVGQSLLKRAAGSGGLVGTVAQLGTTIADMEKQVNGLQKNLDVLKKVKGSLSGGSQ